MGVGDLIGKYIFIIIGFAFYFLAIDKLLEMRGTFIIIFLAEKADKTFFFNILDKNLDGKLTQKEIKNFQPCQ